MSEAKTKVIEVKATDLIQDNANVNQHTERGIAMVNLLRFKIFAPIFAGTNNRATDDLRLLGIKFSITYWTNLILSFLFFSVMSHGTTD